MKCPLYSALTILLWVVTTTTTTTTTTTAQRLYDFPEHEHRSWLTIHEILFELVDQVQWRPHNRNNGNSSFWRATDDYCTLTGVTCWPSTHRERRGQIQVLDLPNANLVGTLPAVVYTLPYLESLVLHNNPRLVVVLDGLDQAKHLKRLDIANTRTTSLSGLEQVAPWLQSLNIAHLHLGGTLPEMMWTQFTNLHALYAHDNAFTGTLPTTIGNLFYLQELYLYDNALSGRIPTEIGKLVNLQRLFLSNNYFTGHLPTSLNHCTDLRAMVMATSNPNKQYKITGNLIDMADMTALTYVDFAHQALQGSIPSTFLRNAPVDQPLRVDLRGNALTGTLPASLVTKEFFTMYLADNQISALDDDFCAQVPQWMGGAIGVMGCDALLCPPGTFAQATGRQSSVGQPCQVCPTAQYFGSTTCSTPSTVERQILIDFFRQTQGPSWKTATNWLDPAVDICSWFGIRCNSIGQVVAILLSNNGLHGTIPPRVFDLPQLIAVNLSDNKLKRIDWNAVGNAQNLNILYLSGNVLTSTDGMDGLALTPIRRLQLGSNKFRGNLPAAIFNFTNLEELDVSHNEFSGSLPSQVERLVNLRLLHLSGNALNGTLPTELGELADLNEIRLDENLFSGPLPTELDNLDKLVTLSLQQRTTSGAIVGNLPAFANLNQLTSLRLAGNRLQGSLPVNFLHGTVRGSDPIEIDLADNSISGEIPSSWADRFTNLFLDLTNNLITGISSNICDKTDWMDGLVGSFGCDAILCPTGSFHKLGRQSTIEESCRLCDQLSVFGSRMCPGTVVSQNDEEFEILVELYDATQGHRWKNHDGWKVTSTYCSWHGISCTEVGYVASVNLTGNSLLGTPPSSLFALSKLQELDLGWNRIAFSFNGIESASTLKTLHLSNTRLDNLAGLEQATNLAELSVDDNCIEGLFPVEILALTNLQRLVASRNQISGEIPDAIASLERLKDIQLAFNLLTGTLPTEIQELADLQKLSLENNFFSGRLLPFAKMKVLRLLNLGRNLLSGPVPFDFLGSTDTSKRDIVVDLISNHLTGGIPASLARFYGMTLFLSDNWLTDDIPQGICRRDGWMGGDVGVLGCDAILCPVNTWNEFGRQTSTVECIPCPSGRTAPFLGSFGCGTTNDFAALNERSLLRELYEETNGSGWNVDTNWLNPDASICAWYGITCDTINGNEFVQSIDLSHNGLTGRVPPSVFRLSNLKELTVAGNAVDVSMVEIRSARNLHYLNIDAIALSSLEGLDLAPNLRQLRATVNNLGPGYPTEILMLTSLETLDLSYNALNCNIPQEASQWTNLKSFSCEKCGLKGFLPNLISGWTKLEYLNLADNQFNGPFPPEIENLQQLRYLDISKQATRTNIGLSGFLPSFATSTTNLRYLYLQENNFFGEISSNFLSSVASTEIFVDISRNFLEGEIPEGLSRFQKATFLFSNNNLEQIPEALCSLGWNDAPQSSADCNFIMCPAGTFNELGRATTELPCIPCPSAVFAGTTSCGDVERDALISFFYSMEGSQWTHSDGWGSVSSVCDWYGVACHTDGARAGLVRSLDLRSNNMVGTFSSRLWLLTELEELDLSDNDIRFESFERVGDAARLTTLKLSNNVIDALTGIGLATSLRHFYCTNCEIHGVVPEEFFVLTELRFLFLNYNFLSGPLDGFGEMRGLVEIHLTGNRLHGKLPPYVGSRFVEVIAFGKNLLSGHIPSTYDGLVRLRSFNVESELPTDGNGFVDAISYGLAGPLPSFSRASGLTEIFLANNALGLYIPENFLAAVEDLSSSIRVDISNNSIRGGLPTELARFTNLRLLASDNAITEIPRDICDQPDWMEGLLADNCDALLCPPGTFNDYGRRTKFESCQACSFRGADLYYGSTVCYFPRFDYSERDILELFYSLTGGSTWKNNAGWVDESSLCDWFGITCGTINDGGGEGVIAIRLPSNNLVDHAGSLLFYLPWLETLDLSGNSIDLSFYDTQRAQSLRHLNISDTHVASIEGIGQFSSLKSLVMRNTAFHGQHLPQDIYNLQELFHLDMSFSGFVGTLDSRLSQLVSLEVLDASSNDIKGELPDALGALERLKHLNLSNNILVGEIPLGLSTITSLEYLDLSARLRSSIGFSGSLPDFASQGSLRYIDVGANHLTGTIPSTLLSGSQFLSTSVFTILLDSNMLFGSIPSYLDRFTFLNLHLADNEIESISPGLCEMNRWWDGSVGRYACDAILCPIGTYNDIGRQDSADNPCLPCASAAHPPFLGQTKCSDAPETTPPTGDKLSIVEIVLQTFAVQLFEAYIVSGMVSEELSGDGPFTLMVPWDGAWEALGEEFNDKLQSAAWKVHLQDLLRLHIFQGDLPRISLRETQTLAMDNGESAVVTFQDRRVRVNGILAIAEYDASNGYAYMLDDVLLPVWYHQTLAEIVLTSSYISTFATLLSATSLDSILDNPSERLSIFAPNNAAFETLGQGPLGFLLSDDGADTLNSLLDTHIVASGPLPSLLFSFSALYTLQGAQMTMILDVWNGPTLLGPVNQAIIKDADFGLAMNGIVHVIDTVLLPLSFDV